MEAWMMSTRSSNRQKGFTLVELAVALAIIGVLAAAGMAVVDDMHLSNAARRLRGVIMQAKGEAVKQNVNCTLVFNQVISGTTFAYVLFVDNITAGGRNSDYDPGERILATQELWGSKVIINTQQGGGTGFTIPDNDDNLPSISFRPNSLPTGNGGGIAVGTIFLADAKFPDPDDRTTCIIISRNGNVRVTHYDTVANQCNQ
jgi:prepilin-type N-terminal cleavage/methylation domain-containing protein